MWRRSKLKNRVWHYSHHRHIALLKKTQVEIRYSVLYKATCTHSERILIVSPEILHTEHDELDPPQDECSYIISKRKASLKVDLSFRRL